MLIIIELLRKNLGLFPALAVSKQLIDLSEEVLIGGDIVEEPLRDEDAAVVLALVGPLRDDIADSVHDVDQGLTTVRALLGDDD